jgi:hypothetical protein
MPVVVTLRIEFASEADAIEFHKALEEDKKRIIAATMRLPDGREVGFDHLLAKPKPPAPAAE